jgi:hypothetical protein
MYLYLKTIFFHQAYVLPYYPHQTFSLKKVKYLNENETRFRKTGKLKTFPMIDKKTNTFSQLSRNLSHAAMRPGALLWAHRR